MKFRIQTIAAALSLITLSCNKNSNKYDASGTFETEEVIVSANNPGKLLSFKVEEGSQLSKDSIVGLIDPVPLSLQKEEVEATIQSLNQQTVNASPQVKLLENQLTVQQSQLDNLEHEKARVTNLLKQDAATGKQLDDVNAQIDVVKKQMDVTRQQINVQENNVGTQNRSILSQGGPLQKKAAEIAEQLKHNSILNPINGTVLTKYAEEGELTSSGKPLYKIADLSTLILRAYITSSQLSQIKLGQTIRVFVDDGSKKQKELPGTLTWVSDKAEFTPKTIQTKEERANLVYAIKVKVKNDGYLKIGMYGEIKFN